MVCLFGFTPGGNCALLVKADTAINRASGSCQSGRGGGRVGVGLALGGDVLLISVSLCIYCRWGDCSGWYCHLLGLLLLRCFVGWGR